MLHTAKNFHNYPTNYPMNFSGKITHRVKLKTDYIRKDGTCAIFIQMFLNHDKKILPVDLSVRPEDWDKVKQRVKPSFLFAADYNLIIEKKLADINRIEIDFRLKNIGLTFENLIEAYENPDIRLDFIAFWEHEMKNQKEILVDSTYRQQTSMLRKMKKYKEHLSFYEITEDFMSKMRKHFEKKLGNKPITVESFVKTFKKILHIANKKGIITPLMFDDLSVKRHLGDRTFLTPDEIRKYHDYFNREYISECHKVILRQFLFSCFTGLRISDNKKLKSNNFIDNYIVFPSKKGKKIQRIPLNKSALQFFDRKDIFSGSYSEKHINEELKVIAKAIGIDKHITFHVSRHTFATNFLISGGRVEILQNILGHTNIAETMIYVHIVDSITDLQIHNMDDILFNN